MDRSPLSLGRGVSLAGEERYEMGESGPDAPSWSEGALSPGPAGSRVQWTLVCMRGVTGISWHEKRSKSVLLAQRRSRMSGLSLKWSNASVELTRSSGEYVMKGVRAETVLTRM